MVRAVWRAERDGQPCSGYRRVARCKSVKGSVWIYADGICLHGPPTGIAGRLSCPEALLENQDFAEFDRLIQVSVGYAVPSRIEQLVHCMRPVSTRPRHAHSCTAALPPAFETSQACPVLPTGQPAGRGAGDQACGACHEGTSLGAKLSAALNDANLLHVPALHRDAMPAPELCAATLLRVDLPACAPARIFLLVAARQLSAGWMPHKHNRPYRCHAFRPQGNKEAGRPAGGGCIINVSSVAGLIANVTTFGDPAFISAGKGGTYNRMQTHMAGGIHRHVSGVTLVVANCASGVGAAVAGHGSLHRHALALGRIFHEPGHVCEGSHAQPWQLGPTIRQRVLGGIKSLQHMRWRVCRIWPLKL